MISTQHAQIYTNSINVLEWLAMLTAGGWFEHEDHGGGMRQESEYQVVGGKLRETPILTQHNAIRLFVEVNLEDIQLDLIKMTTRDRLKTCTRS